MSSLRLPSCGNACWIYVVPFRLPRGLCPSSGDSLCLIHRLLCRRLGGPLRGDGGGGACGVDVCENVS